MTATQAPTPGPLSGDAMRAEYARVEQIREQAETHERSARSTNDPQAKSDHETQAAMAWDRYDRALAKFNAPTAPVEASGSERCTEDMERERREADYERGFRDGQNSRPQPSGETRESADLWYPIKGAIARAMQDERDGKPCGCIIEAGCEARGYHDPDYAASGFLDAATDAVNQLLSARPLALGGQQGEEAAWSWLNRHVECDPADSDYSADEMVDAFMAGAGRYDIWLKALERIAGEQQHRSGYCQTDITVVPALTAEEAQTVARDALTTPARAEALDEGAAGDSPNAVKRLVDAALTYISGVGHAPGFGPLGALHEAAWVVKKSNLYAHPSPTPAADADRVRIAVEALERWSAGSGSPPKGEIRSLLAALKSTAAKEGGES